MTDFFNVLSRNGCERFFIYETSVGGYFEWPGHDLSWHTTDEEFGDFAITQPLELCKTRSFKNRNVPLYYQVGT